MASSSVSYLRGVSSVRAGAGDHGRDEALQTKGSSMAAVLRLEVAMLFERKRRVQSHVGGDLGRRCVMEGKNVER